MKSIVNWVNSIIKSPGSAVTGIPTVVPLAGSSCSIIYASTVDLDEAYKVGQKAVEIAMKEGTGWMATILREPGFIYNVKYDKVPLEKVSLSERTFPEKWISKNKLDVTDDFLNYVRPLIGEDWVSVPIINGVQRFSKLKPVFANKKLRNYIPEAYSNSKN